MQPEALFAISNGLYILSAREENGRFVGSLIDAVSQVATDPDFLMISCMNGSYTKKVVEETGEFALSVLPQNIDPLTVGVFGYQSCRNADKWAQLDGTEHDGMMYLRQALAKIHCLVTESLEYPSNTVFFAKVVDAFDNRTGEPLTYKMYRDGFKNKVMEAFERHKKQSNVNQKGENAMEDKKWTCMVCGYVYDGDVPFEDLPEDWVCPLCGVGKDQFELR